ncbi:MAG: hypothetical protein ABR598_01055 [Candidatus Dormibacteria bacterium]
MSLPVLAEIAVSLVGVLWVAQAVVIYRDLHQSGLRRFHAAQWSNMLVIVLPFGMGLLLRRYVCSAILDLYPDARKQPEP